MLQGGELAARLTPVQRMNAIQKGYNVLNPRDVQAFMNGQAPSRELSHAAGANEARFSKLGMAASDDRRDNAIAQREYGVDLGGFGDDSGGDDYGDYDTPMDPRKALANKMKDYGSGSNSGDLNDKLMARLGAKTSMTNPTMGSYPSNGRSQNGIREEELFDDDIRSGIPERSMKRKPIGNLPTRTFISDPLQAKKTGYKFGLEYLNAFITLLKNPSHNNRAKMLQSMNLMLKKEQMVHPNIIGEYRAGIALAEKALYKKIKGE